MEQARGRRDMRNAVGSGFVTGALLAVRGGPQAMLLGGAGWTALRAQRQHVDFIQILAAAEFYPVADMQHFRRLARNAAQLDLAALDRLLG